MAKSISKRALRKPARTTVKKPTTSKVVSRRGGKGTVTARIVTAKPVRKPLGKPAAAAGRKAVTLTPPRKIAPSMKATSNNGERPERPAEPAKPARPGAPVKNQAGLSSKEVAHYRELLLAKRHELVGDMSSMRTEALDRDGAGLSNLPMHMADVGTDNYEQEFTLGLMEKERLVLREIDVALAKMRDGTYGVCEGTGKPIAKARLEAQPWARFSIEHARKMEKGPIR